MDLLDNDPSFMPLGIIDHRVTRATVRHVDDSNTSTIQLSKVRQVQEKTIWRSEEVSWTSADALRMQNPWVLVNYTVK